MKVELSRLVRAIESKFKNDEYLEIIGLLEDGKTFAICECCGIECEDRWLGYLLPNGYYDIKEIIYNSPQIIDIIADTDEEIAGILEKCYNIVGEY